MADIFNAVHRELIIRLAARERLPATYPYGYFAEDGGLLSTGLIWSTNTGMRHHISIASSASKTSP